jgi:hypothetical protein
LFLSTLDLAVVSPLRKLVERVLVARHARLHTGVATATAWLAWTIWVSMSVGCARERPQFDSVPEVSGLAQRLKGNLLVLEGWDTATPQPPALVSFSWPAGTSHIVRAMAEHLTMSRISEPDLNGTIAFMHDQNEGSYSLRTIRIDGSGEREIFHRPGRLLYDEVVGKSLALSPRGGLVAFVGVGPRVQFPGAYLKTGVVEVWNLDELAGKQIDVTAIDYPLWWLPDGERLIYVKTIARNTLPPGTTAPGSPYGANHEQEFGRWSDYPAACVLNLTTGQSEPILAGADPVLSTDGTRLLTRNGDEWLLLDLKTKLVTSLHPPPRWNYPAALLPGDLVIFLAPPAKGTKPRTVQKGSFQVGSQMWAVKVGVLGTWETQTLVPYFDRRDEVRFGWSER